jgi:type IV secretion system protein VirD4
MVLWMLAPLAVAALCLAAMWLAGAVFVLSNHRSASIVGPTSIEDYWRAYHADPAQAKKLRAAMLISSLLCFLGIPMLLLAAMQRRRPLHGAARFARRHEIVKAGLLGKDGIVVGKYADRFLMLGGQQFALLIAPTRSGKGVGVVIPNMLSWSESAVVNDMKGDVYKATGGFRAKHQAVFVWDPFTEEGHSDRFNPLAYVRSGHRRVGDAIGLANVIYPHNAKGGDTENFFNAQARNLFLGMFLLVQETPQLPLTVAEMLRQASGQGRPLKEYLNKTIKDRREAGHALSEECVDALMRFLSNPDNTLGSVLATFNAPLLIFTDRIVDAATAANDFDLRDLRRRAMTVYVKMPLDKPGEARVLLGLFWTLLVSVNTRELPENDATLKHQVLLVLDEFPALGPGPVLSKGVGYMAGYNLRFLTIAQAISQLKDIYGENGARTLATNHALQIIYAPKEQRDANEYSEMLGYLTEHSVSRGRSSGGGRGSSSVNRSESRRALMLPQELKELGQDKEIVLYEATKPILAEKIFYYKDPAFAARLLPAPVVRRLNVELNVARAQGRVRRATEKDLEGGPSQFVSRLAHNLDGLPPLREGMSVADQQRFVAAFMDRLDKSELAALEEAAPAGPGASASGGVSVQMPLFGAAVAGVEMAVAR